MKLKGKVALITGGAIGIGATTATLFAQEGAEVALTDVDIVRGEETCRKIREAGGVCRFYEMDVSNGQQIAAIV